MPEALHVANGHCTTRLIEQARRPGRTQVWLPAWIGRDRPIRKPVSLISIDSYPMLSAAAAPGLPKGTLSLRS